jgi:hypothetical protein
VARDTVEKITEDGFYRPKSTLSTGDRVLFGRRTCGRMVRKRGIRISPRRVKSLFSAQVMIAKASLGLASAGSYNRSIGSEVPTVEVSSV